METLQEKYDALLEEHSVLSHQYGKLLLRFGLSKCGRCEKPRYCDQKCPCGNNYCKKCFKQCAGAPVYIQCTECKKSSCGHCDLTRCQCCDRGLCTECTTDMYVCNGCGGIMCRWQDYVCGRCKLLWCTKCQTHICMPMIADCGHIVYNTGGIVPSYNLLLSPGLYSREPKKYCIDCTDVHRCELARGEIMSLQIINARMGDPLPIEIIFRIYTLLTK